MFFIIFTLFLLLLFYEKQNGDKAKWRKRFEKTGGLLCENLATCAFRALEGRENFSPCVFTERIIVYFLKFVIVTLFVIVFILSLLLFYLIFMIRIYRL